MRPLLLAALLVSAAFAGCTDKLTFGSATTDDGPFKLEPTTGGKDTLFKVDAGKLGRQNVTWSWGDGVVTYGATSEHKYGFTNGVMTVTLFATGSDGKQGIATRTVTLGTGENVAPTLTLRAVRDWVEVRQTATLNAFGQDKDRDPLKYLWTYRVVEGGPGGDGHGHAHGGSAPTAQEFVLDSTTSRAEVIFESPGRYAVTARVSDPKGGEAAAETIISVSREIPSPYYEATFSGSLTAGSGGAAVSEKLWGLPAGDVPDTNVDSARHRYTLAYPATTLIMLVWNDTGGTTDLDLEVRRADTGETVQKVETRPPSPPPEILFIEAQEPGDYYIVVRSIAGAQLDYQVYVYATLHVTYELVKQNEG